MARLAKIPENMAEAIVEKSAAGWSAARICDWLNDEHKIDCSISNVQRLLYNFKNDKKEIAQRKFADAAAKTADKHLAIFDSVINDFNKEIKKALKEGDRMGAKSLADTMFKFQSKIMDLSGINSTEKMSEQEEELKESIFKKAGIFNDSLQNNKSN